MDLLLQLTLLESAGDSCLEETEEVVKGMETMEVNKTSYQQPDALIPDHPAVTNFFQGHGTIIGAHSIMSSMPVPSVASTPRSQNSRRLIIPKDITGQLQSGEVEQRMHTSG
jgi:hypothetical protein